MARRFFTRRDISPSYYATDAQKHYLKILLNEAFVKRIAHGTCIDPNHISDTLTRTYASEAIGKLRGLLGKDDVSR